MKLVYSIKFVLRIKTYRWRGKGTYILPEDLVTFEIMEILIQSLLSASPIIDGISFLTN